MKPTCVADVNNMVEELELKTNIHKQHIYSILHIFLYFLPFHSAFTVSLLFPSVPSKKKNKNRTLVNENKQHIEDTSALFR